MAKSSKLVAARRGRVLLVRRKRDGLWMFPGGRKLARESEKEPIHPACEMRLVPLHQFPNTQTPPTSRASMVCWAFDTARIK